MKTINKIAGFMLLFFIAGSIVLNAQYGTGRGNMGLLFCTNIPGLTDNQEKEINALAEKHWLEMSAVNKELWEAPDLDKRNDAVKKMQDLRFSHRKSILALLTSDQKNWLMQNNYYYGAGLGRGRINDYGWGMGPGKGMGLGPCGRGYGFGRGGGWGMGRGRGYGMDWGPGWGSSAGRGMIY